MEEGNNSRDTGGGKVADADADAVEETDAMDEEAAEAVPTLEEETKATKQQGYHQPQQPHGQGVFPLQQTTIKEEADTAATNQIRTRGTVIGTIVTPVDMMWTMRVQDANTKGHTIRSDVPGRTWMHTRPRGISHHAQESTKQSCQSTMRGVDRVEQ